jgi:hypothetical protein
MKVCTYNEFEYCKVFDYYLNVCEYYYVNLKSCMNLNLKYANIVVFCIFQIVLAGLS